MACANCNPLNCKLRYGRDLGVCLGEVIFFFLYSTFPLLNLIKTLIENENFSFLKESNIGRDSLLYVTIEWFHFLKLLCIISLYISLLNSWTPTSQKNRESCSPLLIAQLSVYLRISGLWLICCETDNEWPVGATQVSEG